MTNNKVINSWIIFSILIVVGFAVYTVYVGKKEASLVKEVNRDVPFMDRQRMEGELRRAESIVLNENKTPEEKYFLYIKIGDILNDLGRLNVARKAYENAIDNKSDGVTAYIDLYDVLVEMNDLKAANRNLKKALELNNSSVYWRKYIEFRKSKLIASPEELNEIYLEALSKTESHISIVVIYARFLEEQGNKQGALDYWRKAKEIDPENSSTYEAEITRLEQTG